ncbi:hypothetical protein RM11_1061 [Bartonella quintana RM-11]|nr:hypothetical protein RM11_1061 [Bartonella quintana RM-11]
MLDSISRHKKTKLCFSICFRITDCDFILTTNYRELFPFFQKNDAKKLSEQIGIVCEKTRFAQKALQASSLPDCSFPLTKMNMQRSAFDDFV